MLRRSDDTPTKKTETDIPLVDLEFTSRGVLLKKIYSDTTMNIQFIRIAAITLPKTIEIYREKQLPKQISKTIKKLRYNTSSKINEEATYRSLRNNYLLHNQSVINSRAIKQRDISTYLSQLIDNGVDIHIINSRMENELLIIGAQYSSKLTVHPESELHNQIVDEMVNQHYVLDQYPNLLGMSKLVKINRNFQISFFQSTHQHPQMQILERTTIYRLIGSMSKLSKVDGERLDYDINGFSSAIHDPTTSFSSFVFYLHMTPDEILHYNQLAGTSLSVVSDQDKFQTWLLNYSFYLEWLKSEETIEMESSMVVIGGPKPLGYTELEPETLRLDLLEIINNNSFDVWMPVFKLISGLFSFSSRQDVAADFTQYWSDIKDALLELMSQIDTFDKLLEKLFESFENEIGLTDDMVSRSLLSIFNQIRLKEIFDSLPQDHNFSLPKRVYFSTEKYSEKDMMLLVYIMSLRADIEGEPIHSIIINDIDLSMLMTSDKMRFILDDKNTGYDDVRKVYRITRMNQTRFNSMPKIILSYNYQVKQFLNKEWYHKKDDWKEKLPLFEKSCLLLPDEPPRRIYIPESDERFINYILKYESSVISTSLDVELSMEETIVNEELLEVNQEPSVAISLVEGTTTIENEVRIEVSHQETNEDVIITDNEQDEIPIEIIDNVDISDTSDNVELESVSLIDLPIPVTNSIEEKPPLEEPVKEPDKSIPLINQISEIEETTDNLHNADEALRQYNMIFDGRDIYSKLLNNNPTITSDDIFVQIDRISNNLRNLNDFYMDENFRTSLEDINSRNLDQLKEGELIVIHPTGNDYNIQLTDAGKKSIDQALGIMNSLLSELKSKEIDIQNIIRNSSTIMEGFRQQGKIRYEVALLNWPGLISIAYYDKFSKLPTFAYGANNKILSILDQGVWVQDHDEFVKSFVERYQNKLYNIQQEILVHKEQVLEKADMPRMPTISVIRPTESDEGNEINNKVDDEISSDMEIITTTLTEFNEFDKSDNEIENLTDKEIIRIKTYDKEEEEKVEVKPKRTKAAIERAARELRKQQKEVLIEQKVSSEYHSEFADLDKVAQKIMVEKRMNSRIDAIGIDSDRTLYFYQPTWNMSIDENKHKFDLLELPLSLFNFKIKTKKMLAGTLDNPSVGELIKTKVDWTKLPSIGKKTHEEIVDFQLLFENWDSLTGDQIFSLMSRDGLKHLFEAEIYFNPKSLPDNILLPLHDDLKVGYEKKIDHIIRRNGGKMDSDEISRKIIDMIYKDLCKTLQIDTSDSSSEILIHKINQFQFKNHKMSNNEKEPFFDLTWVLKFDNYENDVDGGSIDEFRSKLSHDLDQLMISYQVQKNLLDNITKVTKDKISEKKRTRNKDQGRQLA
ncbi:MAG: hypothetical protein GPJ54_06185 [Candidatus Heimdallarchaeota archaeon]|nr:hypothetical protein [Candidatus Heimdallarchaeota archaeon]